MNFTLSSLSKPDVLQYWETLPELRLQTTVFWQGHLPLLAGIPPVARGSLYTYTHMHVYIYTQTHTYICVCMCAYICIYMKCIEERKEGERKDGKKKGKKKDTCN